MSVLAANCKDNAHWTVHKMSFFSLSSSSELDGTGNMGCELSRQVDQEIHIPQDENDEDDGDG